MDENLLQVRQYNEEGFRPLIAFEGWRVAILNYIDEIHPRNNRRMERHLQTDEVFLLLRGRAVLLLGGNGAGLDGVFPQPLESSKLYNVRRNVWHTVLMSRDASLLIVENRDTGELNSEYVEIPEDLLREIQVLAETGGFD